MIAKGLDFANVTLVGVIDADVGINLPDFRASERCFQLLSQVAGRAGRGPKGGRVLIQTRVPGHHAVQCAVAHDYAGFVRQELAGRHDAAVSAVRSTGQRRRSADSTKPRRRHWPSAVRTGFADSRRRSSTAFRSSDPRRVRSSASRTVGGGTCSSRPIAAAALTRSGGICVRRFPVPSSAGLRIALDRDPVALL